MILGPLGLSLTVAAFGLSLLGIVAAARTIGQPDLGDGARRIALAIAILVVGSGLVMEVALVSRAFVVAYVAEVGSQATPLLYVIGSLWSAQSGSLILWAAILSVMVAWFIYRSESAIRPLLPIAATILFALQAFFLALLIGPTQPWARVVPVPTDGPGPNPLLQNHPLMLAHPPLLYAGFIGLAVPFAVTVAALAAERVDRVWLRVVRQWILCSWVLLGAGLVLGAWWSYAVLGWGGYWAWDPVENMALLPWLLMTAFLHSAMVQRRRGELVTWNVLLVLTAFLLVLLGTLVTRSGTIESVHAFARTGVGPMFAALLAAALIGVAAVLIVRPPREPPTRGALGVRGTAIVLNNLLLAGVVITVLAGTLAPLVIELATAQRVSVGAPYFERVVGPVTAVLVIVLAAGPSLPWGRWHERGGRALALTATLALLTAAGAVAVTGRPALLIGVAVAAFALIHSLSLVASRMRDRRAPPRPAGHAHGARPGGARAIGGLIAHAGIGLAALAMVVSGSARTDVSGVLRAGEDLRLGAMTLRFDGFRMVTRPERSMIVADARLIGADGERPVAPSLSIFARTSAAGAIPTPAILTSPWQDVYVTLLDADPVAGAATVRVTTLPLMSWLWLGGGLVVLGGLLAVPRPSLGDARALVRIRRRRRPSLDLDDVRIG